MKRLPEPYAEEGSAFVGKILDRCVESYTRSPDKRDRLSACRDAAVAASAEYRRNMPRDVVAVMAAAEGVAGCDVIADAYKEKFSKIDAPGREYYDHIFGDCLRHGHGFCPICELSLPSELDHYLPKSSFPALAVTPANLVPLCSECNKLTRKGDYSPKSFEDALYHPYFEDPPSCKWLCAEICFGPELDVLYGVGSLEGSLRHRFERSMQVYGLCERYESHAIERLFSIRAKHVKLLASGGEGEVESELEDLRMSAERYAANGWEAALWRAAISQLDEYTAWLKQAC